MKKQAEAVCSLAPRRRGRPVQMNAAEREAEILRVTADLLLTRPLDSLSTGEIARAVGMSKRTLYELFGSREALIGATIAQVSRTIFRPLAAQERALPLAARLAILLTPNDPPASDTHKFELLRSIIAKAKTYPSLAQDMCSSGRGTLAGYLRAELAAAVAEGEIALAPEVQAEAAEMLIDMAFHAPIPRLLDPTLPVPTPEATRLRRELAISLFLGGCRRALPSA
ncbi:TetR/AcrR family transcriptional regulator [Celeribacter indicus]|uniref:TetR/AcrR family transcriptional regulator n=1 Tax=Celeribacter indicus TaxID=1208324 RepID=UPI0011147C21|nr:TetR/AcrR family transcriptional regulator [Celeribacter indicus]